MKKGFSLLEVLVFVSILSIFIVIALSITTASLRNMKINEHKILATKYAEELLDWLRSKKELDWKTFAGKAATDADGETYCFSVSPITDADPTTFSDWPAVGGCSSLGLTPAIYEREVALKTDSAATPTNVEVYITVNWSETGNTYSVPITTYFNLTE